MEAETSRWFDEDAQTPLPSSMDYWGEFGSTWIGTPNYGYPKNALGRQGHKVIAIVLHIAAGSLRAIDNWFQEEAPDGEEANAVSTHFAVGSAGEVHQYVWIENAAWANGLVEAGARLPADAPVGVNPNLWTVSIEHEGWPFQQFHLAQIESSIRLINVLLDEYGLLPSRETILPHASISPLTRGQCPGPIFPLSGMINILRAMRGMSPLAGTGGKG